MALMTIKNEQRYRERGYSTFDEYVKGFWSHEMAWARNLVKLGGFFKIAEDKYDLSATDMPRDYSALYPLMLETIPVEKAVEA